MTRIAPCLEKTRAEGRKALIAYVVNGDPYPEATLPTMHALVKAGVDIIELGVPFSDPMAEGPTIQLAHERSLVHKTSLRSTIDLIAEFRKTNNETPVLLMGYANPVERMGYKTFAVAAEQAGVDGLLTVDLPPEEVGDLDVELQSRGLSNIFLIAPTTTDERAAEVVKRGSGFIYYVSLKGVTGSGNLDVDAVAERLTRLRQMTDLPLCVGFGIKDADSAKAVAANGDGAIVGSLLVNKMGQMADAKAEDIAAAVAELISPIRIGLDEL